jgi:hypothetical protein
VTYQPLGRARFVIEPDGETIRVPARKQWAALIFLPIWLAGWTVGGGFAIASLVTMLHNAANLGASLFLAFWLCGWALGWVTAAGSIAWMLAGAETLRVVGGDLEIAQRIGPWARRKLYQAGEIRDLRAGISDTAATYRPASLFGGGRSGSVQFRYGARTVRVASGLDEAEGAMIVDTLRPRLPRTATAA